ncbi:MAG TPA: GAF domain-containing sensor histidine kinase [Chloroflexota bacterium]|nr:GAF domain-containing sensor histidine kinase [Chloroflexota bacterium]
MDNGDGSVAAQRRAERALLREQEHLRLLVQASESLLGSLDSEAIIAQVLGLARDHVAADAYAVWRRLPATGLWGTVASDGLRQEYVDTAVQAMNHSVEMPATPIVVPDLNAEPLLARHRHLHAIQGTQALLVVPLRIHQETSGTLAFYFHRPHHFTDSEVHVALALANLAGSAIGVAELYEEQTRLRAEAETAIQLRDQLLALVSHDVKNIVATIRGQAQLHLRLLGRTSEPDLGRLRNGLTEIQGASQRMMNLLNDLLDVSFGRASQSLALQRQPTDLIALARQTISTYAQTTERHRLRLDTALPALVGSWDTTRLERVLGNLLSNAIKYSPRGGEIVIRVEVEEIAEDHWAVLQVADPGIGIPASDVPHVFEPFRRGENATNYAEGAGLGLAGVRQIITEHGGSVAVASEEGQGSIFTLRLPINGDG